MLEIKTNLTSEQIAELRKECDKKITKLVTEVARVETELELTQFRDELSNLYEAMQIILSIPNSVLSANTVSLVGLSKLNECGRGCGLDKLCFTLTNDILEVCLVEAEVPEDIVTKDDARDGHYIYYLDEEIPLGKRIVSIILPDGNKVNVTAWKDVVVELCLVFSHPNINNFIARVSGHKKWYSPYIELPVGEAEKEIQGYMKIPGINLQCKECTSTREALKAIKQLVVAQSIDPNQVRIKIR